MARIARIERKTSETDISVQLNLDGNGSYHISSSIPFFDHMLILFSAHGFFDLDIKATGDVEIDTHHTVEDIGIALGDAVTDALSDRKGITRYGYAVTPMDETLATVAIDLSNRPFLVYNVPEKVFAKGSFDLYVAKEFFRAFSNRSGMNLHINVPYGENEHHMVEAIFKSFGRALSQAVASNKRVKSIRSTKGVL
ncbi:MAG: imidazoleglycerol-phosphate dehydratase HisB [Proteobacteria bacterium]|nr:imidazoleglycerol-phosphate dehydratase HisB [Pseudomonadota bacterium]